jgi:hypothetical protein
MSRIINNMIGPTGWLEATLAPTISGSRAGALVNNYPIGHDLAKLYNGQNFDYWDKADASDYSEEARHGEGLRIVRPMIGPWSQYRDFRNWALGYSIAVPNPNGSGGLIQRTIPAQHPKEPGAWCVACRLRRGIGAAVLDPQCFVLDNNGNLIVGPIFDPITGTPITNSLTNAAYKTGVPCDLPFVFFAENRGGTFFDGQAEVELTYATLPYEIRTDAATYANPLGELSRYVERTEMYAVQAQSVPSQIPFIFNDPAAPSDIQNKIVPGNPFLIIPTKQLMYRWIDVPVVPESAINTCVGTVNAKPFDGGAYTIYPPGTLLMQAPVKKRMQTAVGAIVWEITYRFDYRKDTWNKFLAADRNYYTALANGNGKTLFPSADWSGLFQVPAPVNYYG